jgi:magnesium-transporting ATPase (P-type)
MHPEEDNAMEVLVGEHAHQVPAADVLRLLGTDAENGLDILELRARQARFGPNVIPAARGLGPGMRFLLQFHTPLVYILLAAAAITAILQAHDIGEGLVILAAIFAGTALPILPVQILWINMTTAVLLGLMLAFEPNEPDIMQRPPRDPRTPLLTGELIGRILLVSLILLVGALGSFECLLTACVAYGVVGIEKWTRRRRAAGRHRRTTRNQPPTAQPRHIEQEAQGASS